jgi:hypothetical protein
MRPCKHSVLFCVVTTFGLLLAGCGDNTEKADVDTIKNAEERSITATHPPTPATPNVDTIKNAEERSIASTYSPTPVKSNNPPASVPTQLSFDPNDFDNTLRWVADRQSVLGNKYKDGSDALSKNRLNDDLMIEYTASAKAFEDEVKGHLGEAVLWKAVVDSITETKVRLNGQYNKSYSYHGSSVGNRDGISTLIVLYENVNHKDPDHTGGSDSYLIVGTDISKKYAKTLNRGDKITISGKLSEVKINGPNMAHFHVDNVAASEPSE